jgi:drug/metabolite transporter (DMT)-like permease
MRGAFLYISLGVATFAVSWASIFIRLAEADPIATAFYRMAFAVVLLAPFSLPGIIPQLRKLTSGEKGLLALSGVFLGFHFASWIASLEYTTISNSVIIVSTQPFFVAIMEALLMKTKISRNAIIGMVLAFFGMVIIARSDFHLGGDHFLGDILAFIGAICVAGYLMVGRRIRQKLDNRYYILPVYAIAALTILLTAIPFKSQMIGYPIDTWMYFLLLALIPTIMGHSLYNYLLKFLRAHLVSITVLGEPIGATVFAALIFAEYPSTATYIGGVLILIGILLALFRRSRPLRS